MAVASLVGRLPALACVRAEGGTATARLVGTTRNPRVPGELVHVRLRAGPVVLPCLATVGGAHEPAELDPD